MKFSKSKINHKIMLCGNKYYDYILDINTFIVGETNQCNSIKHSIGGINNLLKIKWQYYIPVLHFVGAKKAFIINDRDTAKRSSIVMTKKQSTINDFTIDHINKNLHWLHIAYLDDITNFNLLNNIKIPFSLDFCTSKNREPYKSLMNKATIIFDSRERKYLYSKIDISTPIIFHDQKGSEICIKNKIQHTTMIQSLKNIQVNGAGDIFAAIFLDNYYIKDLFDNLNYTTETTTQFLKEQNEKV